MEDPISDCLNNDFIRQMLCGFPIPVVNFEDISINFMNYLMTVLSHPDLENYPVKTAYLITFVKKVITQMESADGIELGKELYLKYVELIQKDLNEEGPYYKHYILNNNNISNKFTDSVITIQESTSIVSQGTTGLCTWQAGIAMSLWCLNNQEKINNKVIVELGCGTGLSGISACINCKPSKYCFTDGHQSILDALSINLEINQTYHEFNCDYNIGQLLWDDIEQFETFESENPDLVLAADVVFDETLFEPLCKSLKYFIIKYGSEIILFCTLRNRETYNKFLVTLDKHNLNYTQDVLPDNYSIILNQDCPIYIINVKISSIS